MIKKIIYFSISVLFLTSCASQKSLTETQLNNKNLQKKVENLNSEIQLLKSNIKIYQEQTTDLEQRLKKHEGDIADDIYNETILNSAEVMPQFILETSLSNYIKKNIKLKPEFDNSETRTVFIEFVVEKNGEISNMIIVKKGNTAMDIEAKRVLKSTQSWSPGSINGENVRVRMVVPINFDK